MFDSYTVKWTHIARRSLNLFYHSQASAKKDKAQEAMKNAGKYLMTRHVING